MFDVKKHLIKVQGGRQYLPVAARLIWFRTEHPDWGIETKAIAIDVEREYAIFESTVFNAEGRLMAKGTKMENIRGFGDWLEKAETGAIGRALAVCGYGTQFAPDLDESSANGTGAVDAPYRQSYSDNRGRYQQSNNQYSKYGRNDYASSQQPAPTVDKLSIVVADSDSTSTTEQTENVKGHDAELQANPDTCESCSAQLKPSQLSLSLRKFGTALCPDCQRKRKAG